MHRLEDTASPEGIDYLAVQGLSNEIRQKLQASRPTTIARAGRISGVTPAALSLLLVHIKKSSHKAVLADVSHG